VLVCRSVLVPQMNSLDPDFTVEENLLVYGRYFGMSDKQVHERIDWLRRVRYIDC